MERTTQHPFPSSSQPGGSPPETIHISPSQHLAQLPIAALLSFVPRLRTTYRILNNGAKVPPATGRSHYRLRLGAGQTLYVSDNLLDLVRLIDGRRSIQALSDALAEEQGRPVHPAEIVHLLRRQLVPGGLVDLALPLALPEPKSPKPLAFPNRVTLVPLSANTALEAQPAPQTRSLALLAGPKITRPLEAPDIIQWIPPGRRAERLRATRRPPASTQRMRRASYINLIATFLVIVAAGAAFAFAHAGFSHASFTPPSLNTLFGAPTPTATIDLHQTTPTTKPALPPLRYTVHNGETLATIAKRFGITVNALLLVNNLKSSTRLRTGLSLIIPTVYHPGDKLATLAYPIFYVVRSGDTISSIAQFFGSTTDILIRYNHISNPALIQPGDSLVIPAPPTS
jgi:LysM repeat protein